MVGIDGRLLRFYDGGIDADGAASSCSVAFLESNVNEGKCNQIEAENAIPIARGLMM